MASRTTNGSSKRSREEESTQEISISRSKAQPAIDKSEYQHGSIMQVTMKSFVTYEYCSFSPGPNLNMVIGPNGTGKSTIVCALALGLGWNTSLLGRAKDISEFVKHGADKGWIEIVLCNKNGPNVTIKRHINKNNNTSVWKINGENKTQKDVMKKVQSFGIQVDNLCQFLPQDRVSEFAQMTPQELLRETQRAVGGEDMLAAHQKMIDLWVEHKTIAASMKGDLECIETNEKRNAVIEKDVFRFQQREAVLRKVRLLEIWVLYAKYGLAKEEYNAIKEQRRICFAEFKQLQTEIEPLEKKRRQREQNEKTCDDRKSSLDRMYQKSVHSMKSKGTAIESTEGEGEELRKDLDRLQAKMKQKQVATANIRRKIANQEEAIENLRSEETINEEKDRLQEKTVTLTRENASIRDKIETLQGKQTEIVEQSDRSSRALFKATKNLEALNDIRNQRLENLKASDRDVYDAVLWLRENRQLFEKHVFEPVCLELNIKDMKHVDAIENTLMNHLKLFVCQTRRDYDIFTRELLDKKRWRLNVIAPRAEDLDLGRYTPPVPSSQLGEYGFDCYMLDAIDGPPALLAALCFRAAIHTIPVSRNTNVNSERIGESQKFRRYATSNTSFTINQSRYSGESLTTTRRFRPARILMASVDNEARARLIQEVEDLRLKMEENERDVRELSVEENNLRKSFTEFAQKKDILTAERKELLMELKRGEKLKIELELSKKELDRKLSEPSSEEAEARINDQLRAIASKRCRLVLEYLNSAKESSRLFSELTLATLNRLQAHAELQAADTECSDKARQLKEIEDQYTAVNEQYDAIKASAKELLDKAKEEYNTLQPEDVPEFQTLGKGVPLEELEDMLAGEMAKAALHFTPNQSMIEKYEQRQGEIKNAKEKVDGKQKKLSKISSDIDTIRGPWYTKIKALIEEISEGFSASFQRIGCAGEVKLGEHEDYDKWCIDILVKFRDEEKLQKLTGQRQSGGERSVSTIMYLMALQGLSKVSFRVVDEINQGMDPRNERLVHALLVEKACQPNTAQYFLITPKLLPDLEYHERMKILCIYNGEWLDDGVTKWSRYLKNQRLSNKNER